MLKEGKEFKLLKNQGVQYKWRIGEDNNKLKLVKGY